MTDHQVTLLAAAISTTLPVFAVMLGVLFNQIQLRSLNEDIREMRRDIKEIVGKLGAMDVEIGRLMGKLDLRP